MFQKDYWSLSLVLRFTRKVYPHALHNHHDQGNYASNREE
jgi:hypothetical protein